MRTLTLIVALAAGCATSTETKEVAVNPDPDTEAAKLPAITLTAGDTMTVSVDTSGNAGVRATIAAGKPNAGTYTATPDTAKTILDLARDAKNALGKRGATVWIRLDKNKRIAAVGWSQKLQ